MDNSTIKPAATQAITLTPPEFDFVIVGAGTAGCVLAHRLTTHPSAPSVCVLERGPPHTDSRWNIAMPAAFTYNRFFDFSSTADLWLRYRSEPVSTLRCAGPSGGPRIIECPEGIGWGGTSAVNAMIFVRGQAADYDRWATDEWCGPQWNYAHLLPFFKRIETYSAGTLGAENAIDRAAESTYAEQEFSQYRGSEGPMRVTSTRQLLSSSDAVFPRAFIEAGVQAGLRYNPDFNAARPDGVGWVDLNVHNGERQSAAVSYLKPALAHPNLHVVSNALVSRIILEGCALIKNVASFQQLFPTLYQRVSGIDEALLNKQNPAKIV